MIFGGSVGPFLGLMEKPNLCPKGLRSDSVAPKAMVSTELLETPNLGLPVQSVPKKRIEGGVLGLLDCVAAFMPVGNCIPSGNRTG